MQRHCRARGAKPLAAGSAAPSSPGCARTPPLRRQAVACASRRRSMRSPPSTGRLANTSKPLAALRDTETIGCSAMSNSPAAIALRYAASMAPCSGAGVAASAAAAAMRGRRAAGCGTTLSAFAPWAPAMMSSRVAIRCRKPFDLAADRAAHFADRSGFLVGPGSHVRQRHVDRPGEQQDVIAKLAGIARRPESRGRGNRARQPVRSPTNSGTRLPPGQGSGATARNTPPRTTGRRP